MTHLTGTTTKTALTRALAVTKLVASTDKTLPLLNAVNLTVTARGKLVAQSTDRFMAVRANLAPVTDLSYDSRGNGCTIPLATVDLIRKWLAMVDDVSPVTLTYSAPTGVTLTAEGSPPLAGLVPVDEGYPTLDRIMRSTEGMDQSVADRAGVVGLSSTNAARFGAVVKACGKQPHVVLRPGVKDRSNDMVFRVSDGETVLVDGLIMGVVVPDAAPARTGGL